MSTLGEDSGSAFASTAEKAGTRRSLLRGASAAVGGYGAYALTRSDFAAAAPGDFVDYYNVKDYGAAGNGSADDTAAIQSAVSAAQSTGGGTVFFPSGTYKVAGTGGGAITLGNNIRLLGVGRGSAIKSANNPTSSLRLLRADENATVALESLRIIGPDSYGSGGQVIGLQGSASTVDMTCQDVMFHRLTYALKAWDTSTTDVKFVGCDVDGGGLAATHEAGGVLHAGTAGAELIVNRSSFRQLGSRVLSPSLVHALYVYQPVSTIISNCRFEAHDSGHYIQFFGGNGNANFALIEGCRFGPMVTQDKAVDTNPTVETVVSGCVFEVDRAAVSMKGTCVIANCRFGGDDGGNYWQIQHGNNSSLSAILTGCLFTGNSAQDVLLDTTGTAEVAVCDCVFGSDSTNHVTVASGGSDLSLSVSGCLFAGTSSGGDAINAAGGKSMSIIGNRFRNAGRAIDTGSSSAPGTLYFAENDFSQTGTPLRLLTSPASWQGHNNYGSNSYMTRNGGTASVANGGTINHGLGSTATGAAITPTKFGLTPRVARRVAGVTSVSSTTLSIALRNDAGTAIVTPENVAWWAEQ